MLNKEKGPFQLFYEHLYVIAVVTSVALVAAFLVTGSMDPVYRSQARCFMPAQTDTVSLSAEEGNVPNSPLLPTANADLQDSLLGILQGADTRLLVASRIEGRDSEWLEKNMEFGIDRFNRVTISAFDPDPKMAVKMAEEYLRAFKEKLDTSTKNQAAGRLETFTNGITEASSELESLQAARLAFMQQHGAIDFDSELDTVGSRQVSLEANLVQLDTTIATTAEQRAELVRQIDARPATVESASTTVNNPAVEQLQRSLVEVNRELATLRLTYRDADPKILAKLSELQVLKEELGREEERILGTSTTTPDSLVSELTGQLVDLRLREAGSAKERELTAQELERVRERRLELSLRKAELEAMDSEIRTTRANLTNYRERKAELEIYMSRNSTFLMVPEYPVESSDPYLPILWVNLLVAAVLGITVSVILVIVMTNIRSHQEAALW